MKNGSLKIIVCMLLFVFLAQLSGCNQSERVSTYITNPRLSNLTRHERQLLVDIEKSGIQVIRQGMRFTFFIPTDCFFTKHKRQLKANRELVMDQLANFVRHYMNYFAHGRVLIIGHTDKVWYAPARDRLSLLYAQIIADYFREDGVSPDNMIVRGYGSKEAIAANAYPMGASFNRRVAVILDGGI